MKSNVLLIEDDFHIATEIIDELRKNDYAVAHQSDGLSGFDRAKSGAWDVLILDLMLPGLDGLSVLRRLRGEHIETPTLLLSALGAADQKIGGLRAGADDYLAKPFVLGELLARIEALLRRCVRPQPGRLCAGALELDEFAREAWWNSHRLGLLQKEAQLLAYLMRREGEIVTRAMLLEDVWKFRFVPQTNLVDVHIGRLRRKLEECGAPPMITSVRGAGFVFRAAH